MKKRGWTRRGRGSGWKECEQREREQRIPTGHDPANEPENANQSHDAAHEIVHLRSNAAIPFPGLCCMCRRLPLCVPPPHSPRMPPQGTSLQRCNGAMRPTLQPSVHYRVRRVRCDPPPSFSSGNNVHDDVVALVRESSSRIAPRGRIHSWLLRASLKRRNIYASRHPFTWCSFCARECFSNCFLRAGVEMQNWNSAGFIRNVFLPPPPPRSAVFRENLKRA